jgi:hypothetical protein
LREAGASEADRAAAKAAALEARTAVGEALTELQLLTDDVHVLALADRIVDITFTLHLAANQADRADAAASVVPAHGPADVAGAVPVASVMPVERRTPLRWWVNSAGARMG